MIPAVKTRSRRRQLASDGASGHISYAPTMFRKSVFGLDVACKNVRLSEIPDDLNGEDAGKERVEWLQERLPDIYRDLEEGQAMAEWTKFEATATSTEVHEVLKKVASETESGSRNIGGVKETGDIQ